MENSLLHCAFGSYKLRCYPPREGKFLRAWDAADEYLLQYTAEQLTTDFPNLNNLLIINDRFGSLSVALHDFSPTMVSDSYLSACGLQQNLRLNALKIDSVNIFHALNELPADYVPDAVLMKLPKDLDYFKAQLGLITTKVPLGTPVIASGMVKHMVHSQSQAIQHYLGCCHPSLAKKKARLLISRSELSDPQTFPTTTNYRCELYGLEMINFPNTFSYGQLDLGARFFLQTMESRHSEMAHCQRIIDLGCGDGVLGLSAARMLSSSRVSFIDSSHSALLSARASADANFPQSGRFDFILGDCLSNYHGAQADWILCNPPFHLEHSVSKAIAARMFSQARAHLEPDGRFWVIGNRHLAYRNILKRFYTEVDQIACNDKFLIYEAKFPCNQ